MKKWILYIMVFLSVTACVSENTINIDPNPPFPVEDEPGKVTLQIVFPKMNSGTLWTRAFTDGEEKKIDSMEVFVFENTSSSHAMTDTYLYRVSVPKDSIHALSNDTTYRAVVTLKTRPLTGQRLICVANIPHGLNLSLTEGTSTVTDLVAQLKFSGTPWHTAPTSASDGIPMWGQMNETLTFTPQGHLETGKTVPLITMIRAMAKIEVGVDVNGTGDPALGFGHIFTLDSVFLCRASDSGYIAPHKDFIDKAVVTKTNPVDRDGRMSVAGY
ncbi:MAG: FimB/Mfa2 family fimbrial subunit, partial [Tannerella sp.]|nr:FimB/Mfa2 family fimbrial subunit [Tannerella sp.]